MPAPTVKINSNLPPTSRLLNDSPFWTALNVFSPTVSTAILEKVVTKAIEVFDTSKSDAETVRRRQKLLEQLNVQKTGSGNTMSEQQVNNNDVKWTLRSTQTLKSILQ